MSKTPHVVGLCGSLGDGSHTRTALEVAPAADRVREADAVLSGTPMYHGSHSPPLEAALGYRGFDESEDTTVGLLAVSGGSFPITALDHRVVCRALDAWMLPYRVVVPNASETVENGELADPSVAERIRVLCERATEYANVDPDPACFVTEENVGALD